MYYTVYKITNLINGKFYIGKHQTKNLDDNYFGSGKFLKRAINKYGIENFKKDILEVYDVEWKMNLAERILVVVDSEISYNLCSGGKGGWGFANKTGLNTTGKHGFTRENLYLFSKRKSEKIKTDEKYKEKIRKINILNLKKFRDLGVNGFKDKNHTEEHKQLMSDIMKEKTKGTKNSQFGTMWITNGSENKKINKEIDLIPEGWYKGRVM